MEKPKTTIQKQSVSRRLGRLAKILLIVTVPLLAGFIFCTAVILPPLVDQVMYPRETLTLSLQPGTEAVLTEMESMPVSYIWIEGLVPRSDGSGSYDLRLPAFISGERTTALNFDYLEINGQVASEALNLSAGERAYGNTYRFPYTAWFNEPGLIRVRVLDGFSDNPSAELRIAFGYSLWMPPCLCLY